MTTDQADRALTRARDRIEQIVADKRREYLTAMTVDDVDPDAVDEFIAANDKEFEAWLDGVLAEVRAAMLAEWPLDEDVSTPSSASRPSRP